MVGFFCGWNMLVVVVVYFIPTPEGRKVLNTIGFYRFLHCYINTFPY